MTYTPTTWVNGAAPALNATHLNKIEAGIAAAAEHARTITAGTGLTGGGDLSANRTLAVDASAYVATGGYPIVAGIDDDGVPFLTFS